MGSFSGTVYGAGHANLDRDHALLLALLERLKTLAPADAPSIQKITVEFLAYLDAHCENEEALMDRYRYPARTDHKQAHDEMKRQAAPLLGVCEMTGSSVELVARIQSWIETHECAVDVEFARFLNTQDVPPCVSDMGWFAEADTPA
jgi:hemerythrin-like metal-binding protein